MSKIEELSKALADARDILLRRKRARISLAEEIVRRLEAHLGGGTIRYMPSGQNRPREAVFDAPAAITRGPNGFWDLGLELSMPGERDGLPFSISFRENGDQFILAFPPEREPANAVRLGKEAGFGPFFDALVERLKNSWLKAAQDG